MLRQRLLGWPDQHVDPKRTDVLTTPGPPPKCLGYALRQASERPPRETRVLDIGCGRGDTVALLRSLDYDAHGIEVEERYLQNGRPYFGDDERLRLIGDGGRYPFPDDHFDVVVSDQVLEHVEDLRSFAQESARVLRPGGVAVHNFPAKWRPVEPHMFTPFAHWLPKGRMRDAALRLCVQMGLTDPRFGSGSPAERAQQMAEYSTDATFYRPLREIRREFQRAGLVVDMTAGVEAKLRGLWPGASDRRVELLAPLFRHFRSATIVVSKPPRG